MKIIGISFKTCNTAAMVNTKIMLLGMAFGAILGMWLGFSITSHVLHPLNFVFAFVGAIVGFLSVYYFYKFFY